MHAQLQWRSPICLLHLSLDEWEVFACGVSATLNFWTGKRDPDVETVQERGREKWKQVRDGREREREIKTVQEKDHERSKEERLEIDRDRKKKESREFKRKRVGLGEPHSLTLCQDTRSNQTKPNRTWSTPTNLTPDNMKLIIELKGQWSKVNLNCIAWRWSWFLALSMSVSVVLLDSIVE